MNTELEILKFRVARTWAKEMLGKKISYADEHRYFILSQQINDREGLEDAQVLLRMIFEQVKNYNAKINTKISLLDRMNYTRRWEQSACFKGLSIPHKAIDELINKHPESESWPIVKLLMGW